MVPRICPACGETAHSADTTPSVWVCPYCGVEIPPPEVKSK